MKTEKIILCIKALFEYHFYVISDCQLLIYCLSVWAHQLFVHTYSDLRLLHLSQCVFIVKPLCEPDFPLLGFELHTAFSSGLLIINVDREKVTTGLPGVTVAMATLINILSMMIGW